jgi:hypothetical protein
MPGQRVRTVTKRSFIAYGDRQIDFPFQKNIHQLPLAEFIECLHDLYFARDASGSEENFEAMLHARFGRSIAEKFLIPYEGFVFPDDDPWDLIKQNCPGAHGAGGKRGVQGAFAINTRRQSACIFQCIHFSMKDCTAILHPSVMPTPNDFSIVFDY